MAEKPLGQDYLDWRSKLPASTVRGAAWNLFGTAALHKRYRAEKAAPKEEGGTVLAPKMKHAKPTYRLPKVKGAKMGGTQQSSQYSDDDGTNNRRCDEELVSTPLEGYRGYVSFRVNKQRDGVPSCSLASGQEA